LRRDGGTEVRRAGFRQDRPRHLGCFPGVAAPGQGLQQRYLGIFVDFGCQRGICQDALGLGQRLRPAVVQRVQRRERRPQLRPARLWHRLQQGGQRRRFRILPPPGSGECPDRGHGPGVASGIGGTGEVQHADSEFRGGRRRGLRRVGHRAVKAR